MRNHVATIYLVLIALVLGCNQRSGKSEFDSIVFGRGISGLVAKVKQEKILICMQGQYPDPEKRSQEIQDVVLKWIEPLRQMSTDPLTQIVETVQSADPNCDATVNSIPGVHAHTQVTAKPTVNVAPYGNAPNDFSTYKVLLHEFGHAFGLGDTYYGGRSGQCQPGQPQSIMCNTQDFNDPQADDIEGVQKVFKATFPNDVPGNGGSRDLFINIALARRSNGEVAMLFSTSDVNKIRQAGQISYCVGTKDTCAQEGAVFLNTTEIQGTKIFLAGAALENTAARTDIVIRYSDANGTPKAERPIFITP